MAVSSTKMTETRVSNAVITYKAFIIFERGMVVFETINEYTAYIEINVHTQYIESIYNIQNRCMHTERLEQR